MDKIITYLSEITTPQQRADEANFAAHRRWVNMMTPPGFKDPRFRETKELVVALLELHRTPLNSIEFTSVNTEAQKLNLPIKGEGHSVPDKLP